MVYAFFAGGGAVKFVKDYDGRRAEEDRAAGTPAASSPTARWKPRVPAAQGVLSPRMHYADNLETPRNNAFRKSFALSYKAERRRLCRAGLRRRADAGAPD